MLIITIGVAITLAIALVLTSAQQASLEAASAMVGITAAEDYSILGKAIGGGIATLGMLGTGIGQGFAAGKAAEAVGRNPEAEGKIRNTMIVGSAIAESGALYSFVIAIMIIFVL